jgi:hypothetical protein
MLAVLDHQQRCTYPGGSVNPPAEILNQSAKGHTHIHTHTHIYIYRERVLEAR